MGQARLRGKYVDRFQIGPPKPGRGSSSIRVASKLARKHFEQLARLAAFQTRPDVGAITVIALIC